MPVKDPHPLYLEMMEKWQLGRDSYDGSDAIKGKSTEYLPPTTGMIIDGAGGTKKDSAGQKAYEAYLMRAYYPDIYSDAIEAAIGIMHREPPIIELPSALEELREKSTLLGEPLEMLLRRINAQQLISGRLGLLGDIRTLNGKARPVIVMYKDLSILNWDDSSETDTDANLQFVVLNESGFKMDESFKWVENKSYRVLGLTSSIDGGEIERNGTYYGSCTLTEDAEIFGSVLMVPNFSGNKLNKIPFSFINAIDISPSPSKPPLTGLAHLCLTIYRGEADYRQNLFLQGQDTLVRIGGQTLSDPNGKGDEVRTGAGTYIDVPMGGDAKYIGVSSQGLPEQRQSLESDYNRAIRKSGQLIDSTSRAKESGDALRIRVAAQTATLPQIAQAGATGLEDVLKDLAVWVGANPDEVKVTPNLKFTEDDLNGTTLVQIMQAKIAGAPISQESVHVYMQDKGFTKKTYEEELSSLSNEEPGIGGIPSGVDNANN